MKGIAALATTALALNAVAIGAADPDVRVIRLGSDVSTFAGPDLVSKTTALLESCSTNSSAAAAAAGIEYEWSHEWSNALASQSLVHIRFPAPRQFQLDGHSVAVNEILVPLPAEVWPSYILVRSGEAVLAFAHYQMLALRDLSWSEPLTLGRELPYSGLGTIAN